MKALANIFLNTYIHLRGIMEEKLTSRQREIFDMLIKGVSPKEIAYKLGISYNTYLFHKKEIYQKLGVHSVHDLVVKYFSPDLSEGVPGVFFHWYPKHDDLGSTMDNAILKTNDVIEGESVTSYNLSGFRVEGDLAWTGALTIITHATLEAMKTMKAFSFKVLGDGNAWAVLLTTKDTLEGDGHGKIFSTTKDKITTITVNVDELKQEGYGKQTPFIQENIHLLQFYLCNPGPCHLKIWDIRSHKEKLPIMN